MLLAAVAGTSSGCARSGFTDSSHNYPIGLHFFLTLDKASLEAGIPGSITVVALDGQGHGRPDFVGAVQFAADDSAATVPTVVSFAPADLGVKKLVNTLSSTRAGVFHLKAALKGDSGRNGSLAVRITPGPVAQLKVSPLGSFSAGQNPTVIINALDRYGNTVTNYTAILQVRNNDPQATKATATVVLSPSDQGLATLTLPFSVGTSGSITLIVTDPATGLTTQSVLPVTPGRTASFQLVAGSPVQAAVPESLQLLALDSYGNVDSTYRGTVTFSSSDASATLPSAYVYTSNDYGNAAVGQITLRTVGSQTLTATDIRDSTVFGRLTNLKVLASSPTLAVSTPTPVVAGVSQPFTLTITAADGTPATAYGGTLHVTSDDPNATLPADFTLPLGQASVVKPASVTWRTSGPHQLTIAEVGNSNTLGRSNAVTVAAAAVSQFSWAAPVNAVAGQSFTVTVGARDTFGNLNPSYRGTVAFNSTDAAAVLPSNISFTAANAGSASITVTLRQSGTQTLTVTDTGSPAVSNVSSPILVVPAAAGRIFLSSLPNPVPSGTSEPFTVTVADNFNNTVTGYRGTVHVTSSDTIAVLPGDYTFVAGDAGVHGLAVAFYTNGLQSLTVQDAQVPAITTTQGNLNVVGISVSNFSVTGYTSPTAAGSSHTFTVSALDANAALVPGYRGTVHFQSSDAAAGLPVDYSFTAVDSGVHTFSATLQTAGSQSLSVNDTFNVAVNGSQSGIVVNALLANHFSVTGFASPQAAGAASTVVVTARDPYNNVATSYRGTAHFTSNDAAAVLPADLIFTAVAAGVSAPQPATLKTAANSASITATDVGNGAVLGSQTPIVISPAALSKFLVSGFANPTAAGSASSFTVVAQDTYNNTVSGYLGTVKFTSNDGAAVLPGNYTFSAAQAGSSAPQSAKLLTAGAGYSLTATDLGNAAVLGTQGGISVNAAALASFTVSGYPTPVVAGTLASFVVTAVDAYGNTATGYRGTVAITSSDAAAQKPGNYTFMAADAGSTGSLLVRLRTAATHSITATDLAPAALNGSQAGIVVGPAAAAAFVVAGYTTPGAAGVASAVTVTAKDAFANTATGYLGTVQFTSNDGAATLPGNYTFTAGVLGVSSSQPVTLKTVTSTGSITATDVSVGTLNGAQTNIVINPAAVASFMVAGYTSGSTAGVAGAVTVTAKDSLGNTVTGYRGTVTFTSNDGAAILPGNYTFAAGDAGVSVSQSVTLKTATSTASITATDVNAGTVTGAQTAIVIRPSTAASFVVAGYPSPATAGAAGAVTVTARDAFANTATGYLGTVSFTSSDGAAILPGNYTFTAGVLGVSASQSITLKTTTNTGSITATDVSVGSLNGAQTAIVISPAAAASFVVAGYASPSVAGVAGSITVTAKDVYANIATGYRGTVQFTSNDGAAALPGTYTFTVGVLGVSASQAATLKTVTSTGSITATDVVTGSLNGVQSGIVINPAAAASFVVTGYASPSTAGVASAVTVTAKDAYANTATGYLGTVSFTSNDGAAVLPGNYTFTAGALGISASQAVTLKTATSTGTLTATDIGAGTLNGTQTGITIRPAVAVSLVVAGYASPSTAGVAGNITVTAKDAYANTATAYLGTINFTSSDGAAALPGNYTFTAGVLGVSPSQSATLKTVTSTGSITATDVAVGTLTGAQSNIVVSPAAIASFVVAGYTSPSIAGVASAVTVTARDSLGNTVTGYRGTVGFTSNDGAAVLPGNYTFTAGNAGVSASQPVTLKTVTSTGSITATDVSAGTVTGAQTGIVIRPAAAASFVVSGYPSPSTAGVAGAVIVTAKDAFANTATGYLGTVSFSSNDGAAVLAGNYTFTAGVLGVSPSQALTLKTATSTGSITATDISVGSLNGVQTGIVIGPAAAASFTVTGYASPSTAGTANAITVTAKDVYANTATGYLGTINFTSNDGAAALPGNYTFTAGVLGVSTSQAVTLKTVTTTGSVTATDVSLGTLTGAQTNIVINPAAIASFAVAGFTSPSTAGIASGVTVTAKDSLGNTVTGYRGTVSFTSNDGAAVLPGTYTFTAGNAGVSSSQPVTLKTVTSTGSITATDVGAGTLTGVQTAIVIRPAAAASFVVTGYASPSTAGVASAVTVTAKDAFANTATGYLGTVNFTSSDGAAVLPGNYTFTAGVFGVSTSQSVALKTTTSTGYITATDINVGGLNGTQTAIVINPAAAASFVVAGYATPSTAGVPSAVTVTAKDAFANIATSYLGTVQFTSNDGAAVLPGNYTFTSGVLGVSPSQAVTLKTVTSTGTLTATDVVTGTLTGVQTAIVIKPAAAVSFVVAGYATPSTAGVAGAVTVTARDAYANTATGYLGTVNFTSNDGTAVLPGNYTFTAGVLGVSTGQAVTLKIATSTGSITATDINAGTLTGAQTSIVIRPAAAAFFVVAGYASPSAAGVASAVTVTAEDVYANTATSYLGTVTFTSNDGAAALPGNYTFTAGVLGVSASQAVTLKTVTSTGSITATDVTTGTLNGAQTNIVINPAAIASFVVAGYTTPSVAGVASGVTVTAKDSLGNIVTGYRGTVSFTSNDGAAALPGNYTFTAGNAGVSVSQTVTLKTVTSTGTITATDVGAGTVTGVQSAIVIRPAAAASFVVAGYASPSTAGVSSAVTVTAKDAFANTATGYLGTVNFTSSDGAAVLPGNYTFTAGVLGVSTSQSVTLRTTTSTGSITATDMNVGSLNGAQTAIVINPAAAASFAVAGYATPSTAGVASAVTVTAKDAFANIATSYLGTVQFTSNDGAAVLPGNYTFTAGVLGVSASQAITLKTVTSTGTITATDVVTGTLTGVQTAIVIRPAAAASFLVTGYASPSTAGVASAVTVTARDAYANAATGYLGTVSFTSNDGTAVLPGNYTFTAGVLGVSTSQPVTLKIATSTGSITATDINAGTLNGAQTSIVIRPAAAASFVVAGYASPSSAGVASAVTVTAKDVYTNTATSYLGTVTFTSNDGAAALPGNYTFTAGVLGVSASQAVTLKTVTSTGSITATDVTTGTLNGAQTNIVINPAAIASFVVAGYTSPSTAGVASAVTVTAKDSLGNTVTGYRGTVNFTSNDGAAVLPGNYTFTAGNAGVSAGQTVTLKTVTSTGTITATDMGAGTVTGVQNAIVIRPAAAVSFLVAGYTSPSTAGVASSVTVTAKDAFANTATGYLGTVNFTSSDGAAVLPGNYTFTAGVLGVSTSQGVTLKTTTSTGSITATDINVGGLNGAQTNIVIRPAAAATFVVAGYASPSTAGVASAVTVTAKDAFANIATSYLGTVQFTSNDGAAVLPGNYTFTAGVLGVSTSQAVTLKTVTSTGTITATDLVTGTLTGVQSAILIQPAAAVSFVVAGYASPSTAGVAGAVTVTAKDAYANTATGYLGTVNFTSNDGAAVLPGNYIFTAGVLGVSASQAVTLKTVTSSGSITATDINAGTLNGAQTSIVIRPAAAASFVVTGYASPSTAGVASSVTVTAKDAYANTATGYLGTVTFTSNDGAAALPGNYTFTAGVLGVSASQAATLKTVTSTGSITATDVTTGTLNGAQTNIVINPAAIASFVVAGYTTPSIAGVASGVTVTAKDSLGNTVTGYRGTVSFTSNDGAAALPGNYTFTAGNAGVAPSQTVTLKTVTSTGTITATDVNAGTVTGVQTTIVIRPAAAASFVVAGYASPSTAGVASSVTVTAKDAFANTATGYLGTVTFTSNNGGAILPGNYTFTAGVLGVSPTQAVTLQTATTTGSITATDVTTGTLNGSQINIVINPAAATSFVVAGYATPSVAGVPGSVTVTARDAFANTATAYLGTVHFTSNDAQAVLAGNYTFTVGNAGVSPALSTTLKTVTVAGTLTATDVTTGSVNGVQSGIVINSAAAASFVVAGYASPNTAGVPSSVVVTAKDAYANTATTYAGTVVFNSNDLQAALPGNFTFTVGLNGVSSSQAVTLKTATLSGSVGVTDITTSTLAGVQTGIVINTAVVTSLAVTGYTCPSVAGTASSVAVVALDAYYNTVSTYLGTVHFTSTDLQASLPADYVFLPGNAGASPLQAMTLKTATTTAGITATDVTTGSINGSQSNITVLAAPLSNLEVAGYACPSTAGVQSTVTVTARDAFLNVVTGYQGTVAFTSNDAQAVLPTNFTFLAGYAGVSANQNVTLKTVTTTGSITATDVVTSTLLGNQNNITIVPAGINRFTVSGYPLTVVAGTAGSVTITAKDAFNNTATGYRGTVQITSNDPAAQGLPANYTFTLPQLGVSNGFPIVLQTAGSGYSITATDVVTPGINGAETGITINNAPASVLLVSGYPSVTTAGNNAPVLVTAQDPYGNTATSYTGTVAITTTDPNAVLPANHVYVVGDFGSSNAMTVTLKTSGSRNITATDTVNSALTGNQNNITVNAAATHHLVVAGYASPSIAGVPSTFAVTSKDIYNNTTPAYRGTVVFNSNDTQAVLPGAYTFTAGNAGVSVAQNANLLTATTVASLTATDVTTGTITGTQAPIIINPAATNQLLLDGFPCPTTAGVAANTLYVVAVDAYDNVTPAYQGTVAFTSTDLQAVLPGNYTFLAADNGVSAAQSATLLTASSTAVITATDVVTGSITGNENNIIVNPSTVATLLVDGFPCNTVAGTAAGVYVVATDTYSNVATSYVGTVAFTSNDAQAALPTNLPFTPAMLGLSGLQATTLYTATTTASITATDTLNAGLQGNQNSIIIVAASTSQLQVSGFPCPVIINTAATVSVSATDAYDNVTTNYRGTVSITSNDPNALLPGNYTFQVVDAGTSPPLPVTLKTAGPSFTITGTDVNNAAINGNENNIRVTLTLTAPGAYSRTRRGTHNSDADHSAVSVVTQLFEGSHDWTHYVQDSGTLQPQQAPCDLAHPTGGGSRCLHAAEYNVAEVRGFDSCQNLTARDALDAFMWTCDDSSGAAKMVSYGLRTARRLADLIDWNRATWQENSVTVSYRGRVVGSSDATSWWDGAQLRSLPEDDAGLQTADRAELAEEGPAPQPGSAAGAGDLLQGTDDPAQGLGDSATRAGNSAQGADALAQRAGDAESAVGSISVREPGVYLIDADEEPLGLQRIGVHSDHVALVVRPRSQLAGTPQACGVQLRQHNFTWMEGSFKDFDIEVNDAAYAVLRHIDTRHAHHQVPLAVTDGRYVTVDHVQLHAPQSCTHGAHGPDGQGGLGGRRTAGPCAAQAVGLLLDMHHSTARSIELHSARQSFMGLSGTYNQVHSVQVSHPEHFDWLSDAQAHTNWLSGIGDRLPKRKGQQCKR